MNHIADLPFSGDEFFGGEIFNAARALNEGWMIEFDRDSRVRLRGVFYSDLEAWWHVAREAARGSEYHQAALRELCEEERFAIEVHCGPLATTIL
ncbi:hypothetical protein [Acidomonas methanolica]|uniref:hypothetical protein n=1 Tax=Acidomonas methanolica TaxID=437 RepID=UPI00211A8D79|nr:hypothetical protein [Acidomonas methanolica]MCQ9156416.1 hypothetical protein [Acidomonas methanolica]